MSEFSEEPRFTIEQIDLLQRLRRSGMSKPEILQALDTLERLDREHGDKFGRRTSSSSSSSSCYGVGGANGCTNNSASNTNNGNAALANAAAAAASSSAACNGGEGVAVDQSAAAAVSAAAASKISTATQTQFVSRGGLSPPHGYDASPPPGPPPPAVLPSPASLVALSQNGRDSLAATPNGKLSPPRYPVNGAAAARAFGFEATEEELDIDDKVEELMRSVGGGA
ncbi:Homeobox-containing protein 1 [Liparis tanakae]|uniref:Homeobox-containing protein 1 n=1 Tax=Liparis tanakae TaxID=230148 RepID=A0A4Z2E1J8_9TELE|nr:Homeobox-containing protein 1 [Liparis tanakae]